MKKISSRIANLATALLTLWLYASPLNLLAQDPAPDLSFNGSGKWFYTDGPSYETITDIAVDASGRIILAGYTNYDDDEGGKNRGVVIRLLPNGTQDPSFSGGKVYIDFPNSSDAIGDVALDQAGNILLAGYTSSPTGSTIGALFKLNGANGALDAGFGTGGRAMLSVASSLVGVAVLPSGKIATAGEGLFSGDYDLLAARFNANGTLDTGFGTNAGYTPYGTSENEYATAMVVQSDGKIVVSGYRRTCTNDNCLDPIIGRFLDTGQFDTNFGLKVISEAVNEAKSFSVALQKIGTEERIVLSGIYEPSAENYRGFVLRLRNNGNPDGSFCNSTTGFVPLPDMQESVVTVQGNNKILLASYYIYSQGVNVYARLRLMRLNADGCKDTTFGNGGTYDQQLSGFIDGPNVVHAAGNKIYVAGGAYNTPGNYSDVDGFVARFTTGPTTAAYERAESLGIRVYPNPVTERLTITSASAPLRRVSIVGAAGLVLASYDAAENEVLETLDMSGLPAGLYFVQIIPAGLVGAVSLPVLKL